MPCRAAALGLVVTGLLIGAVAARAAEWNPQAFANESTVQLRTEVPSEGEYWFPVWVVVIDNQAYVRLGSRAADRVQHSRTAPYLGVRVAGQQFDHVRGTPAPEMADTVAAAMRQKYWSDVFVRYFNHPLTLRLVPE